MILYYRSVIKTHTHTQKHYIIIEYYEFLLLLFLKSDIRANQPISKRFFSSCQQISQERFVKLQNFSNYFTDFCVTMETFPGHKTGSGSVVAGTYK